MNWYKNLLAFLLALFFFLALGLSDNKALALSCQTTSTSYSCMTDIDIRRGLPPECSPYTAQGRDCPSESCTKPGTSISQCVQCTRTSPRWDCADPVCGAANSCPRSYTWETCGTIFNQCNTFTTTDSVACPCAQTCSEAGGACTLDSTCPSGTSEIFGAVCPSSNDICCTQPTPTPTPTPVAGCQSSNECGNCSRCCAGNPNYCSTTNFDCAGNTICGQTPTPAPITCKTDAASASGCEKTCMYYNNVYMSCNVYNQNSQNVCSTLCTSGGPWNCVVDSVRCPAPASSPTPAPTACRSGQKQTICESASVCRLP